MPAAAAHARPFAWLNAASRRFLSLGYLPEGQDAEARLSGICEAAERRLAKPGFGARLWDNLSRGWYSLSTPIWCNFGDGQNGLPISCFGSHVGDSMESILHTHCEVGMMTKLGGGTSAYFGDVRPRGSAIRAGGSSDGPVHFMQLYDTLISIVSQGQTRRGNFAAWLPVDHPDVMELLAVRSEGNPVKKVFPGVCVSDAWMEAMVAGDRAKRKVWAAVLEARQNRGLPYVLFTDAANRDAADVYRDKGMRVTHSNLCTEIMLPDSAEESFVCDLSSMNVLHYDEWKGTDAVEVLVCLLDAVMSEFIDKAAAYPDMARAVRFARRHRALGVGQVGWHSYLQSRLIPYEGMQAKCLNVEVARAIRDAAFGASRRLAAEYGEPEVLAGYGRRNTTLLAHAPTKSSAFIHGQVSESTQPHKTNYMLKDLAKGKYTVKNPHLQAILAGRGRDTREVWEDVLRRGGSVQHLAFLSEHERAVFKTLAEISPREVVTQAAQRQRYIDQGQSLNLMIGPDVPTRDVNALMIEAWRLGLKSLYYQYGVNASQEFCRNILTCASCEG